MPAHFKSIVIDKNGNQIIDEVIEILAILI